MTFCVQFRHILGGIYCSLCGQPHRVAPTRQPQIDCRGGPVWPPVGSFKRLHEKGGFKQRELAEFANISARYCHDLQHGLSKVSFGIMARLHRKCGLDLNKLAELIDEDEAE